MTIDIQKQWAEAAQMAVTDMVPKAELEISMLLLKISGQTRATYEDMSQLIAWFELFDKLVMRVKSLALMAQLLGSIGEADKPAMDPKELAELLKNDT